MDQAERLRRLGWFLPLRLASYIIIASIVVVWMQYPGFLHLQFILYSVLTLTFTVALALERRVCLPVLTQVVIALQFALEISIESGVIYTTGNVQSSFSALYILTIVSAALAYRLVGTLIMSSVVSVSYAFIIWLGLTDGGQSGFSMSALKTIFAAGDSVFYSIFLHILIFYLVAFISGYLAERLSSQDRQLADASRELRRARLETDDILRHLNSGLLTVDPQGDIIYFNRAAERILGYTEEQARGISCTKVFAERMPNLAASLMDGVKHQESYPRKELAILDAEHKTVPLGLSTSILTEDDGTLRGVIAIFSDLTEAKSLESRVRAADRLSAVGELSASIAHEIRNPLAAISGSVEVLRKELSLSGDNEQLMELIVKESDRLSGILTDFLTFARISPPVQQKVELCHLVSEITQLLRHDKKYHETVTISIESAESIVYVLGEEGLIRQLLMNLALNACQSFAGKRGTVVFRIVTQPTDNVVNLTVLDNGPGIAPGTLEHIFEPFFSTRKEGTGLGLSIVHRVATVLGLHLHVESSVGRGSSFHVQFPSYHSNERMFMVGNADTFETNTLQ